jgi:hypothetical protein
MAGLSPQKVRVVSKKKVTEGVTMPQIEMLPNQMPQLVEILVNALTQDHGIKGEIQLA